MLFRSHKNNIKPCAEREARLFEALPFGIKAIVGMEFTYEQFRKMAEAKTYPEFYLNFEKSRAPQRNVIMTRAQTRKLLPEEDNEDLEVMHFDDDEIQNYEEWMDPEAKEDKHVTFDVPDSPPDQEN